MTDHPVKVGTKEQIDPTEYSVWLAKSAANTVHADAKKRPLTDLEKGELHEAAQLLEDACRD